MRRNDTTAGKSSGNRKRLLLLGWTLGTAGLLARPAGLQAQAALSQSDLYCAGYFSLRPVESSLRIQSSEDGGFKNEFATGDYVYLNQGQGTVGGPGQQYAIIRPVKDVNRKEAFAGQRKILEGLGTLYAEVGRIEVASVHEQSATAKVVMACDAIERGDIAVPFQARTAPAFKSQHITDRFAASSGKATGLIAAAKEFDAWLGEGKIVYLNLGSAQGLQPGSYLRIVREYLGGGNAEFAAASRQLPADMGGMGGNRRLTPAEEATLPREVIGEVMVLSVQDSSATGIITYSRSEAAVGDMVELE
ncbi:MAG TPA: hypothetical protein VNN17_06360 [Terriglobia bacterium]|nr:hypothetical protein [Terriglobia bacterium]